MTGEARRVPTKAKMLGRMWTSFSLIARLLVSSLPPRNVSIPCRLLLHAELA